MSFHWDDVRFFLEITRAGSQLAAARRMGVSHTTVARHIARLQTDLGAELFERGAEGLGLTETGQEILSLAQRMEDLGTALADRSAAIGGAVSGRLRIGAPDGVGNSFLSRHLPGLRDQQPGLEIEYVPVPRAHKLWRRDVDISIALDRPRTGRIVCRKLVDYDLRLYGSRETLNRVGHPLSRQDLCGFDFVGYVDDLLYAEALDFNAEVEDGLRVPYRAATVQAQLDAVQAGRSLGVLPCFMADAAGLVPVLPSEIGFERSYWLLIPEDIRDQSRVRVAAEYLVRLFRDHTKGFRFAGG